MTLIRVGAEAVVRASADRIYKCLADYRRHHPRILPRAFSDLVVEEGGVGAGTIIRFRLTIGGQTRQIRMKVEEPEPGRVLREIDLDTGAVTDFIIESDGGTSCAVKIETEFPSAPGLRGFIERRFAPRLLRGLFQDELALLGQYLRVSEV